jgi:hypothetical protein
MSPMGQNAKNSHRAYVGRSTPDSRHCSARLARQESANSRREQMQQYPGEEADLLSSLDHLVGAGEQRSSIACCTGRSAGFSPFRIRPAYRPRLVHMWRAPDGARLDIRAAETLGLSRPSRPCKRWRTPAVRRTDNARAVVIRRSRHGSPYRPCLRPSPQRRPPKPRFASYHGYSWRADEVPAYRNGG